MRRRVSLVACPHAEGAGRVGSTQEEKEALPDREIDSLRD